MTNSYDIIIIDADLNGLTAAAYLAQAGQRVLVLDRHAAAGGPAITEEVQPGFLYNTYVHQAGWISPQIISDLKLTQHGLQFLQADAAVFAPLLDGGGLTLWRDVAKSVESIRRF